MTVLKYILKGLGILILAFIAFSFWYTNTYSMEDIASYEINDPSLEKSVLIATQGSLYKDELVESVIDSLKSSDVYIQVIDISGLEEYYNDRWDAIVLIHTWEYSQPPKSIDSFIPQHFDPEKMLVITTSGSGEEKMEGVDALTGASKKGEIKNHKSAILQFLENELNIDS
ncbi:MAG: hypothetical protein ABJG47_17310 [Ekhidna sp.]